MPSSIEGKMRSPFSSISKQLPEYSQMFQLTGAPTLNQGIGGVLFKTWDKRKKGATQLQQELQRSAKRC